MKKLILALALAAIAVLLTGEIDLVFSMLRFPNVGFGQENMEITGCGRMDGVIRFKYFYWFCIWFGLLSPLLICPAVILLRKRKAWMIALLCMLPLFSYFEVNAGVQAGFHYRGQLLERFGKQTDGYMAVDRLMPSDVRQEYDWGPRSKQCVVAGLLGWAYWPLWNLLWVLLLLFFRQLSLNPDRKRQSDLPTS